ncbi:Tetratricopeptide repeat protein [Symmachiella dynata]|uniref:Tetratricopeptide repeat protein n=1 Tax=Symmachiella dynata TaxID=2527995 RepID=A0A517ZJN1_9PLAN|nr:tetratricopeptide repeat protein [Symmachiella dynata]QDU42643.1 Tetratricopeptide repeat protein [Symmachiella dynata]
MEFFLNESYAALFFDEMEEYQALISQLTNHLIRNGRNVHALNNRAVANWEIGNVEEAKADLESVLDIGADNHVPYHKLGEIYEKQGDLEGAIALYSKAVERWPSESSCYSIRAYALFCAKRWVEAIPDFDKALEIYGDWKKWYLDRATAKEKIGDWGGAEEDRQLASQLK